MKSNIKALSKWSVHIVCLQTCSTKHAAHMLGTASNEGWQRFHNHGEGPYYFSWLKAPALRLRHDAKQAQRS